MVQNFDVYDNKNEKVVTNQPSPVVISGLNPATKYSGYKIAYTGKDAKTTIDYFTTKASTIYKIGDPERGKIGYSQIS